MARTPVSQLSLTDNLLTLKDERGKTLLAECYASMQLSRGTTFSMHAMECTSRVSKHRVLIQAGGNAVLPHMELQATLLSSTSATITLTVTNTTTEPLYIERLDTLVSRGGYRNIPTSKLQLRRTGWQMSTPAAVRVPFAAEDPWLQPPLHMPMMFPSSADQRHLPWVTVLQSAEEPPLLVGFGSAKNYLGIINLRSSSTGHRITASNHLEGIVLEQGETLTSEPLVITWGKPEPQLLDTYGMYVAQAMEARKLEHVPTGWSHWLYYFADVTEKDIRENMEIIAEKDLPFEYIQIDDGYQTAFGDWLSVKKDTFPGGMQKLATDIRQTGRKPGIWISPFMADSRSKLYKEHPDWFLHDYNGRIINVNRHGDPYWAAPNYGLDITHPEAYAWLKHVITTMCQEWGYEYLKLDFLYAGAIRAKRYDPNCTSVQAYRRGMQLIRDIAGDRVVLGCGAPFICSVGMVDTMRIGPDLSWEFDLPGVKRPVDYTLPTSRDPLQSLLSHMWMNHRLWINDADYVRVRQHHISLGWTETIALTSLIAIGGGVLYNSDKLAILEEEGYALLDRLFPAAEVTTRPVGKVTGKPSKLLAQSQKGSGLWHIAARFNWSDKPMPSHFYPSRWELPNGRYHVYDLIRQEYLGAHRYTRLNDVDPRGVSLFSICEVKDRPQVVATEGHLLGPAGDIANVSWEENTLSISLAPETRTDPKIYVHIPPQYKLVSRQDCVVLEKKGTVYKLQPTELTCSLVCTPRLHAATQKSTDHVRRALKR